MRKRVKKLALTLLLSAALLSMNMNFVYAEEMGLSDGTLLSEEQASDMDVSSDNENVDNSEMAQQTDGGGTEETDNNSAVEETTDNSVPDENGTESETGEQETSQDGDGSTDDGTVADDTAAADTTDEETSEKVYINQDGEEVLPSTLVGVDYDTIAEDYDGAMNVVKQYVVSDTEAANMIMDSYIDEEGNLILVISQGPAASDIKEKEANSGLLSSLFSLDAETGSSASAPAVDGSFTGWDDIPASYDFNWNKPDAWVDGVHYTETNSTDVRNEFKLYTDGENVYLKVVFARELSTGQIGNGNDYQFWIDNEQMAAYQVEWPNGNSLSYNTAEPGVYVVDVRHRDSSWSYVLTDGAVAYYRINDGNLNNELELKIPLSEFVTQNPNINLDNYNMISFYTPNLMLGKVNAAGASTGAEPFAAAVFLLVPASYVWLKRKDSKEDMAFA